MNKSSTVYSYFVQGQDDIDSAAWIAFESYGRTKSTPDKIKKNENDFFLKKKCQKVPVAIANDFSLCGCASCCCCCCCSEETARLLVLLVRMYVGLLDGMKFSALARLQP